MRTCHRKVVGSTPNYELSDLSEYSRGNIEESYLSVFDPSDLRLRAECVQGISL